MKKSKTFLVGMLATAFALSGCEFMGINLDPLGLANLIPGMGQNQGENGGNNKTDNNGGSNTETGSLLDNLKAKAKAIAAKALSKSESAITFGEFEDENAEADVYYYESSSLTFVDVEVYYESFNTSLADTLKGYLPSGVTLSQNNDWLDYLEDYGMALYDRIYTDGTYSYDVYVEAYDAYDDGDDSEPAETYGCVYIYKTTQQDAFDEYFSVEEE